MMESTKKQTQDTEWTCVKCNIPLTSCSVDFEYWGVTLPYSIPKCPVCGLVFVSEELATVRMVEVEQNLEDK